MPEDFEKGAGVVLGEILYEIFGRGLRVIYRVIEGSNRGLEFKIYISYCQSVSNVSTFLCYKNVCIEMDTGIFIF